MPADNQEDAGAQAEHEAAPPLTYHQRQFGTHSALERNDPPSRPRLPANVLYLRSRLPETAVDATAGRGRVDWAR